MTYRKVLDTLYEHSELLIFAIVVLFGLPAFFCGSNNTGQQVGAAPTDTQNATQTIYHTGDVVQVDQHTVTLNTAEATAGRLRANFTIENKGSDEMNVSSMLSFYAKDGDGTKLESDFFDCGASLDGKVLTGDKLRGDLCWKDTGKRPLKVYYEASLFGSGAVVWEVE